jgi:hypothetical protein
MNSQPHTIVTYGEVGDDYILRAAVPHSVPRAKLFRILVFVDPADEISEDDWHAALAGSLAFDFLHDEAEDLYTLADGRPFSG